MLTAAQAEVVVDNAVAEHGHLGESGRVAAAEVGRGGVALRDRRGGVAPQRLQPARQLDLLARVQPVLPAQHAHAIRVEGLREHRELGVGERAVGEVQLSDGAAERQARQRRHLHRPRSSHAYGTAVATRRAGLTPSVAVALALA